MHYKDDSLVDAELVKECIQVATMLYESVRVRAAVGQLVRVAHAYEVRRDTAAQSFQVRNNIAPEVGRGRVAVQKDDGIAVSYLCIRHLLS